MYRIHISRHILFVHLLYFSHSHLATDNYRTTWFRFDQYLLFTFTLCNKIQITLFIKIPIIKIYCFFLCFIKNKIWKINYPITINSNRFKKNSILRATSSVSKFHMHHLIQIRYATVQRQNANGVVSSSEKQFSSPGSQVFNPFHGGRCPFCPRTHIFLPSSFVPSHTYTHARARIKWWPPRELAAGEMQIANCSLSMSALEVLFLSVNYPRTPRTDTPANLHTDRETGNHFAPVLAFSISGACH